MPRKRQNSAKSGKVGMSEVASNPEQIVMCSGHYSLLPSVILQMSVGNGVKASKDCGSCMQSKCNKLT